MKIAQVRFAIEGVAISNQSAEYELKGMIYQKFIVISLNISYEPIFSPFTLLS